MGRHAMRRPVCSPPRNLAHPGRSLLAGRHSRRERIPHLTIQTRLKAWHNPWQQVQHATIYESTESDPAGMPVDEMYRQREGLCKRTCALLHHLLLCRHSHKTCSCWGRTISLHVKAACADHAMMQAGCAVGAAHSQGARGVWGPCSLHRQRAALRWAADLACQL